MTASHVETTEHTWVASLWPEHLRFFSALNLPGDDRDVESYQVVPRTNAGQRDWAYVGRNPSERDTTRGLMLLYKNPHIYRNSPKDVLCPVGIRVQGFIERCNLKPLGTWTTGKQPQGALQFIVLSGGKEHHDVFAQYKAAVCDTVQYIYKALDVHPHSAPDDAESIFVGRRVFTKVTPGNKHLPSVLERGDDPLDLCQTVSDQWRVLSKANIGMYLPGSLGSEDGDIVPCNALALGEGDFVDVCVGFDIVQRREHDRSLVFQVHLKIEHVLLLAAAQEISTAEVPSQAVAIQNPGLFF